MGDELPYSLQQMDAERCDPPEDGFISGSMKLTIHEADGLPKNTAGGMFGSWIPDMPDAYVRMCIDDVKGPATRTINNETNPKWEESFVEYLSGYRRAIHFYVNDSDTAGQKQDLGKCSLPFEEFTNGGLDHHWIDMENLSEKDASPRICVSVNWLDSSESKTQDEVPFTKFKLYTGNNKVHLYQDAHVGDCLPPVPIQSGDYLNLNAWDELYDGIMAAKHFIYITGWSVHTGIYMRRGLEGDGSLTIGEMLKQKAEEGLKVLVLIWNDASSIDNPLLNSWVGATKSGMLCTSDEATDNYFEGSNVQCELVGRSGDGVESRHGTISALSSVVGYLGSSAVFTHHQKTVMFDAPCTGSDSGDRRKVVGFVGGLDLTNGRYDTPEHPIFSTLQTTHTGDYYQGYGGWDDQVGPRQPWHDIHGRLEGPVVRDVVKNFEDRWRKQVADKEGDLFDFGSVPDILGAEEEEGDLAEVDPQDAWSVQFFRSIDSTSAIDVDDVEYDIQRAYIHYIRKAERFIYIENQYFLGSSTDWAGFDDGEFDIECKHRVPVEIAHKIVDKIRRRERFCAYIVIPMHPEGLPETEALQAILCWQMKTVQMMYQRVASALANAGIEGAQVTDYLQFFFPGQREPEAENATDAPADERQQSQVENKRQMIYVHSKMMIVDDEWIIMGSANINERSMAGDRDTEVAFGATQPSFQQATTGQRADGQISGFRLSLWAEHFGSYVPDFLYPESTECARTTREIGETNWEAFNSDELVGLPSGHACNYPYLINGAEVTTVQECFTDMGGLNATIKGNPPSAALNLLTT